MMRGALKADGRIAAKNALKIRAALLQSIDSKNIYDAYLETQPNQSDSLAQNRARARAWVMLNVRVNPAPLIPVLERTWAMAWVTGEAAANQWVAIAREKNKATEPSWIDWESWSPGDLAAALLLRPTKAFQQFLAQFGITLKELSTTTINDIGNSIADAVELGMSSQKAAKLINKSVANPARALMIAITEQNRAMSAATINRYREMQIQQMEWEVSDPCPKCAINAGQVVNLGETFNSGNTQPPAHPNCRCVLLPVIPDFGVDIPEGATLIPVPTR